VWVVVDRLESFNVAEGDKLEDLCSFELTPPWPM
jgi:hypothetical protein